MTNEDARRAARNPVQGFADAVYNVIDGPITWFRNDPCCKYEAQQQFKRDKLVDNEILSILRYRFEDCVLYEAPDHKTKCLPILETYRQAEENWFSKYGDLGYYGDVRAAYFKQKHRMVWERRHGKIGSGRKDANKDEQQDEH